MKSYVFIPHVADLAIKVEADTMENLFISALEGMNNILKKDYEKESKRTLFSREIELLSIDTTSLLIDFLSGALTLSMIDKAIFQSLDFLEFKENKLRARLIGTRVDKFMTDIKAVTHHEAKIIKNKKGNYETKIVFDV